MTATVAMHELSYAHIKDQLDALDLDIEIITLNKDGVYEQRSTLVEPHDMEVDYLWLAPHYSGNSTKEGTFGAIANTRKVGILQTFNAGLDDPFYKVMSDKGTRICNSSAQAVAISEYVMAQVLSVTHPIERQRKMQADKKWKRTPFRELSKTNWLVIGFGPIGQEVCKRVRPFGAGISVIRRSPKPSPLADRVGTMADLESYLPEADIIVLACPLNDETRGFVDGTFFRAIKENAILVNIARGGLIEDAELLKALDNGRLETAILDVFHTEPLPEEDFLWSHPQVRLTSHTSFNGSGVNDRWDQLFLSNIVLFAQGEPLEFEVNPSDI